MTNRRWGWGGEGKRKGKGKGNALFYPGVGDKRVNHEVTASGRDKPLGGRRVRREEEERGVHMVERARVWRAVESVGRGSRHGEDELKESRQRGGQIVPETI